MRKEYVEQDKTWQQDKTASALFARKRVAVYSIYAVSSVSRSAVAAAVHEEKEEEGRGKKEEEGREKKLWGKLFGGLGGR